MRYELARRLCKDFPIIYRKNTLQRGGRQYDLPFFFETEGIGWYNIIRDCSEHLEKIANLISPEIEQPLVVQVKEKFGGLRIYVHHFPAAYQGAREMVRLAEGRSFRICEYCGQDGQVRHTGWMKTMCDQCYSLWNSGDRFKKLHELYEDKI